MAGFSLPRATALRQSRRQAEPGTGPEHTSGRFGSDRRLRQCCKPGRTAQPRGTAGDGIISAGDPSGGYWFSSWHGEIKVKRLSPVATIAFSGRCCHSIRTSFIRLKSQPRRLCKWRFGKLQTFNQDGKLTATVAIRLRGSAFKARWNRVWRRRQSRKDRRPTRGQQSLRHSVLWRARSNNFEQARPLVLTVRLDGQNNVLFSWPPDAGKVRIEMTARLSSPIQWTVLTNLPVLANGQPTITVPSTLRALPTLCFRGVSESAAQTPGRGTGNAASPLAGATESVSAALDGLNQIPITGTAQDFEARVNQQLGLLQNAVEAFDAALGSLASQSDPDIAALSKVLLLGRTSEDAATRQVSLAGAIGKANSGFVPSPLTDVINQFKQLKETVDNLKKLKKQIKDGSDLVNLITQNKSLEEIAASRSSFFKQISEVFKKMRADVEAPLNEMLLGKNQGRQDDVDDYTALVAFVRATDARLADLMSAPGFTIDSYRVLNLTDRQKDLVAQAFRSSTLRGRLYLPDNLLIPEDTGVGWRRDLRQHHYRATGGRGEILAELAKRFLIFSPNTGTPTTLRFICAAVPRRTT